MDQRSIAALAQLAQSGGYSPPVYTPYQSAEGSGGAPRARPPAPNLGGGSSLLAALSALGNQASTAQSPDISITQEADPSMYAAPSYGGGDDLQSLAQAAAAFFNSAPGSQPQANKGFVPSSFGFGRPLLPGTGNALAGGGGYAEPAEAPAFVPGFTGALNDAPLFSPYNAGNPNPGSGIQSFDWGNSPFPQIAYAPPSGTIDPGVYIPSVTAGNGNPYGQPPEFFAHLPPGFSMEQGTPEDMQPYDMGTGGMRTPIYDPAGEL